MIKNIVAAFCLLCSAVTFSQQTNSSPYSYYGTGDLKFKGTAENRAMGGLGIIADSIHLNLQNPGTYAHLKLATFTVAGSNSATTFKSSTGTDNANRTTLDYLAVGLPFNKLGIAFGLMPYTSVGYRIQNTAAGNDELNRFRRFEGEGGLNRVFAGAAYRITPKFSIGADFQYFFGNIDTKSIISIPDFGVQYPVRELNQAYYNGASVNIGANFQTMINKKYNWETSATYMPSGTLGGTIERQTAAIAIANDGRETVVNQVDIGRSGGDVKMPARATFGSGIGKPRSWFAGAEYTFQESNEFGNRFDNISDAGFESSHRMSAGGYYIPNFNSFTSYFSRMTYRAGFKYEKTGLVINNQSVNDYSFTLGFGFPMNSTIGGSNINLGFEYGKRGTTNANLVQENYLNIFVSLSLNDRWFIKRKYD